MKDWNKFVEMVETMREAQTNYFKTRHRNYLQRSMILEGLVDKMIQEHHEETDPKFPKEQDLFA